MRVGKTLVTLGSIISVLGFIFHLQGQAVLGPESSFMYSNPDWVTLGIQIMITGFVIIGIGSVVIIRKQAR